MKHINTIYLAEDLSIFKTLDGNRSVEDNRVEKIITSIKSVGFIPAPIVVNENFEVIDGQGRLEACKRLGIPIPFMKVPGIGIEECLSMNINQKNWSIRDYINSYADRGNENYIKLREFLDSCGFQHGVGMWLIFRSHQTAKMIKTGCAVVTDKMFCDAQALARYMHNFDFIETNRRIQLVSAIAFALTVDGVTRQSLKKAIENNPRAFTGISDVADCISVVEDVYNKGKRKNYAYIKHAYDVAMNESSFSSMLEGKRKLLYAQRTNALFDK